MAVSEVSIWEGYFKQLQEGEQAIKGGTMAVVTKGHSFHVMFQNPLSTVIMSSILSSTTLHTTPSQATLMMPSISKVKPCHVVEGLHALPTHFVA